jgi:hypothetical protein
LIYKGTACRGAQASTDLVEVGVDAEVEPRLFATKVASAISSDQYIDGPVRAAAIILDDF